MKVSPYLNFDGNCREAMDFYKSVFGGEFDSVMLFEQMPEDPETKLTDDDKKRMMHMSLPIGEDLWIMASDILPSQGHKLTLGNQSYISLTPDSKEEGERIFKQLSEGGNVEMPFEKQFWGDYFASFTDKYGIGWMINWGEASNESK